MWSEEFAHTSFKTCANRINRCFTKTVKSDVALQIILLIFKEYCPGVQFVSHDKRLCSGLYRIYSFVFRVSMVNSESSSVKYFVSWSESIFGVQGGVIVRCWRPIQSKDWKNRWFLMSLIPFLKFPKRFAGFVRIKLLIKSQPLFENFGGLCFISPLVIKLVEGLVKNLLYRFLWTRKWSGSSSEFID